MPTPRTTRQPSKKGPSSLPRAQRRSEPVTPPVQSRPKASVGAPAAKKPSRRSADVLARKEQAARYSSLRQARGTKDEVADLLGVDRSTLFRRENADLPINREAFLALEHLPTKGA